MLSDGGRVAAEEESGVMRGVEGFAASTPSDATSDDNRPVHVGCRPSPELLLDDTCVRAANERADLRAWRAEYPVHDEAGPGVQGNLRHGGVL